MEAFSQNTRKGLEISGLSEVIQLTVQTQKRFWSIFNHQSQFRKKQKLKQMFHEVVSDISQL